MKKIILLFVALSAVFATACDDDTTSVPVNPPAEVADGEWHLVQVTGSIAGINHQFEPGTITWTFNDNWTVDVENTNTNENLTDFFASGTYSYSFVPNEDAPDMCESVLMVNNIEFGCREIDGDEMTLTNTWADGYQLRFIKM